MKPLVSEYYGDEDDFTELFRVNHDEVERYARNGRWNLVEGLVEEYQSGLCRNLYPISNEKAQKLIEAIDNSDAMYRPEYTKRHEDLLKKVFGQNETLETVRHKANDTNGEYLDIEGELLPYICGDIGDEDDEFLADDLIGFINGVDDKMGYYEAKYDFPLCNHREELSKKNIGYSIGITEGGVPFEAEIFEHEDEMTLSVIIPSIFDSNPVDLPEMEESNILYFRDSFPTHDYGILDIGMVDDGEEDELDVTQKNVDFLVDNGIITFASNYWNGTVEYRVDELGNDLTKILITLKKGDEFWAYTDLDFRPFNLFRKNYKVFNFSDYVRTRP